MEAILAEQTQKQQEAQAAGEARRRQQHRAAAAHAQHQAESSHLDEVVENAKGAAEAVSTKATAAYKAQRYHLRSVVLITIGTLDCLRFTYYVLRYRC
jgi:hypothetical protein